MDSLTLLFSLSRNPLTEEARIRQNVGASSLFVTYVQTFLAPKIICQVTSEIRAQGPVNVCVK